MRTALPEPRIGSMDSSRIRLGTFVLLMFVLAVSLTACGGGVDASRVDQAVALMTHARQAACAKTMQFYEGPAEFRCGDYFCYVEPRAKDHGYGHVIEGASYYDCDDRYAYDPGSRSHFIKSEKCVVEDHEKMTVLSDAECHRAAWMPGMWG